DRVTHSKSPPAPAWDSAVHRGEPGKRIHSPAIVVAARASLRIGARERRRIREEGEASVDLRREVEREVRGFLAVEASVRVLGGHAHANENGLAIGQETDVADAGGSRRLGERGHGFRLEIDRVSNT